ncbi:MAG TPA: hypothetical protein VFY29_19875 [Terriglobia bacterium]|nr:hypothetical protein [Terriglobia bacterium]
MNSEPVEVDKETSPAAQPEPFAGSAVKLTRMIDGIRSLEKWYAADFERRISSLADVLKTQLSEELRAEYSAELEARTERIREQYEERLYAQASEWQAQRASLTAEIQDLRQKLPSNSLLQEIARVEATVNSQTNIISVGNEGQSLDAAAISRLLQRQVEELETRAYLRGLKFSTV